MSPMNGVIKNMKCKILAGCLLLGLSPALMAVTSDFYVNDGVVICPPQIPPQVDATNFVNNNFLSINFTNTVILPNGQFAVLPSSFVTANTYNFTNTGVLYCNGGLTFDLFDTVPVVDTHKMAANFVNSGTISCGSGANTNFSSMCSSAFFSRVFKTWCRLNTRLPPPMFRSVPAQTSLGWTGF